MKSAAIVLCAAASFLARGGVPEVSGGCATEAPAATGWSNWSVASGGNGHRYMAVYTPQGMNWYDADAGAKSLGGYLATLTSGAENAFVFSLVSSRSEFWYQDVYNNGIGPWLGGRQPAGSAEPGGGWQWVTGEAWSFTSWSGGEPNNSGAGEDRLEFFGPGTLIGSVWNDLQGTVGTVRGYMVERESCSADMNVDEQVDDADFSIFVVGYDILDCAAPAMAAGCPADLNRDGLVDDADFSVFVVAYDAFLCP